MATMRLQCIHSCMVLTVVGLLLVYSAFLTSPSFVDSNGVDGEATGSPNLLGHNESLLKINGTVVSTRAYINGVNSGGSLLPPSPSSSVDILLQQQQLQVNIPQSLKQPPLIPDPTSADQKDKNIKRDLTQATNDDKSLPTGLSSGTGGSGDTGISGSGVGAVGNLPLLTTKQLKVPTVPPAPPVARRPGTVLTKDIYESGFLYPNPNVCPNEGQDTRLLILIASAPNHFSARDAIRLTWGHYATRLDVNYAFVIGKTDQEATLDGIETEKHLYDDLIVANFEDSYDNLTLKTMSSLEWTDTYCNQSDYVLKTDDDMFINVPNLLSFIEKIEDEDKKEPKLYGRLARKWKPVRNKKSKYYISFQQYKKTVYPDFNTGPAYLFRTRLARPLFERGMQKTYLKLEDVYTTGIVAQELRIKRMNIGDFANKKVNLHKTGYCALSKLISLHMVAYHEQFELWKKMEDKRTKCKVVYSSKATTNNNNNNTNSHSNKNSNSNTNSNNTNNGDNSSNKQNSIKISRHHCT